MPAGPGVRVDTAVEAGERIPPDYDPLIAKIMVVDTDRPAAIARLARALDETVVTGVQTTLPFHRVVIAEPAFLAGDQSIDWVDRHWTAALLPGRAAALEAARWAAAAAATRPPEATRGRRTARTIPDGESQSEWARAGRRSSADRWPA
jgi:acetyl/propionyl-CoA carboxylase alpha subunit